MVNNNKKSSELYCIFNSLCMLVWSGNSFRLNLLPRFLVMITWGWQWTPFGSVHMLAEHNCTSARTLHNSCFMRFMTDFTSFSSNWNIFCDRSEDSCLPYIFAFVLLGCSRSSHLPICLRGTYTRIMIACAAHGAPLLRNWVLHFKDLHIIVFFPRSNWNNYVFRMFFSFSSFLEKIFLFYNVFSKLQFHLDILYFRVLLFLSFFLPSTYFKLKTQCIQCTQSYTEFMHIIGNIGKGLLLFTIFPQIDDVQLHDNFQHKPATKA